MTDPLAEGASFRDPHGQVYTSDGVLYRRVSHIYAPHYDHLRSSGLYERLVADGLLVTHEETDPPPDAYRVLRPERIGFVSYPYEWCFSQLRDAALLTLAVQAAAMDHGMTLVDASAYNVQFRRGRPVLIDTLSFERRTPGEPWIAYGQFCRHFLAPLALASASGQAVLRMLVAHLDGIPLDMVSALLPRWTRVRPGLQLHLHAHARAMASAGRRSPVRRAAGRARFSDRAFRGLVDGLAATVTKLRLPREASDWLGYEDDAASYSAEAADARTALVAAILDEAHPRVVFDLGANTGRLSRLAAARGADTVSMDADAACVEDSYARVRTDGETNLLPLVQDLSSPSPRVGWDNLERASLADRGPADLVMALALVHHLGIANNVPFDRMASFFASLGRRLVVEFVPRGDPRLEELVGSRRDIFGGWTVANFEAAFERKYSIDRADKIPGSARVVYSMTAR